PPRSRAGAESAPAPARLFVPILTFRLPDSSGAQGGTHMRRPTFWLVNAFVITAVSLVSLHGGAPAVTPASATIQLQSVLTGLTTPVYVTSARDGTDRRFIVEQRGVIKVLQPGATTPTVFLDITSRVPPGGQR